tara:strand:+ start:233 stop:538 length:306 start_codon:yes stop_codon:yes gene_type:complete
MKLFRHGDLLIRQVLEFPPGLVLCSVSKVIAQGEKTGHHHVLNGFCQIYQMNNEIKYFEAKGNLELTHPEHNTLEIPIGKYVIEHEREYNPFVNLEEEVYD